MIVLFIISYLSCIYFNSVIRFIPIAVQASFINDTPDKKDFFVFRLVKDLVTGNVFFLYIALVIGYFSSFVYSCMVLYHWLFPLFSLRFEQTIFAFFILFILIFLIVYAASELISKVISRSGLFSKQQWIYIPGLLIFLLTYPIIKLISFIIPALYRKNSTISIDFLGEKTIPILLNNPGARKLKGKFDQELKIIQNALLFSKTRIRDCMIPRTEVEAVEINTSIDEVKSRFISTGYSKLIVYQENIDNIVGFISSKEIFKQPLLLSEKLSQIGFVPESMPANKLLHEFMNDNRSIAVVVDEYGGTSGIVTLEDIMEEIFGDIEDEHDTDDLVEKIIRKNEYILSGRLEIEYLNTTYNLNIPEKEEYGTLAGFILYHYQNLPKVNDVIKIESFSIKILKVTNTRIDLVLFKINPE